MLYVWVYTYTCQDIAGVSIVIQQLMVMTARPVCMRPSDLLATVCITSSYENAGNAAAYMALTHCLALGVSAINTSCPFGLHVG